MSQSPPLVLVADDQPDVLEALRLLLKAEGYALETAASPAGILAALEAREFDVVLMDLNYARDTTSGKEGLDLLSRIQRLDATLRSHRWQSCTRLLHGKAHYQADQQRRCRNQQR